MTANVAPDLGDVACLDPALYEALAETFGYSWLHHDEHRDIPSALREAYHALVGIYQQGRMPEYATEEAAAAYALGYLHRNYHKVRHILLETSWSPQRARGLKVLDLGVGPGTVSLGVIDALANRRPEAFGIGDLALSVTCVDRSPAMLRLAERMLAARREADEDCPSNTLRAMHPESLLGDFRDQATISDLARRGPYDLIAFGNCLGETIDVAAVPSLWAGQANDVLSTYIGLLADDGLLLVIEPGYEQIQASIARTRKLLLSRRDLQCEAWGESSRLPNPLWRTASPLALQVLGEGIRKGTERGSPYAYLLLRKKSADSAAA